MCKQLNQIIIQSKRLQYKTALAAHGLVDSSPAVADAPSSKLDALQSYLEAWETLTPREKTTVKGPTDAEDILFSFSDGVWSAVNRTGRISVVQTPSILRQIEPASFKNTDFPEETGWYTVAFDIDPAQDLYVSIKAKT